MSENKVNPIPSTYQRVIPYLIVKGAQGLVDFLKTVFDAEERDMMKMPDGTIAHGEVVIGDSTIMISEASEMYKENPTMLYVYVEDVDAVYKKALDAGATSVKEPVDQFYGDRSCMVTDATGNSWGIATHVEDVAPDEMAKRAAEAMSKTK
ncbi:MAG: VOC family protein [Ignavibacteriae bacterium]|nr:VOC family protein [Ignavibacteriota bacterium]